MSREDKMEELIEAYLANRLSGDQKVDFERQMSLDKSLAEKVEKERKLVNLLLEHDLIQLRQRIGSDLNKGGNSNLSKNIAWGLGSLLVVIGGILYFSLKMNETTSEEEIVRENSPAPYVHERVLEEKKSSKTPAAIQKLRKSSGIPESYPHLPSSNPRLDTLIEDRAPTADNTPGLPIAAHPQASEKSTKASVLKCDSTGLRAKIHVEPSLKGATTGSIYVTNITPSHSKLTYAINNQSFVNEPFFEHLSPAVYRVYASDEAGCRYLLEVVDVKETLCPKDYQKTFSPDLEQGWELPLAHEAATVSIRDKSGNLVYDFQGRNVTSKTWGGETLQGEPVPTGVYKVFINYEKGETCVATVTVFR